MLFQSTAVPYVDCNKLWCGKLILTVAKLARTNPEQSYVKGPAVAKAYGLPIWAIAKSMTVWIRASTVGVTDAGAGAGAGAGAENK